MEIRYPALLEPQEPTGYCMRFPDLDEAITEGDTLDECLFNAAEVLTLTLEGRLEEDQPIPEPTPNLADAHYIAPEARTQAALLVRKARGERVAGRGGSRPGHVLAIGQAARGSAPSSND